MIQKQTHSEEAPERTGTGILHTLTYTLFHVTELFFIITGPQIIKNEVKKKSNQVRVLDLI